MSEQKTLTDALKEASTLLLDGDEGYKLQRVAELLQNVAELEAERSELQSLLGDILAAHDQFGEITYLVDRIKNSLKTK